MTHSRGLVARIVAALGVAAFLASCDAPAMRDTDAELFRTRTQLTGARALNMSQRVVHYYQQNGTLPTRLSELELPAVEGDSTENPANDAWGRPFAYRLVGSGFEIRSVGADGVLGSDDDIQYQTPRPDSLP